LPPVPATAGYGAKNLLRIENLSINEDGIPAIADDAVHISGYFGDTTGNGSYSSLDSSRLSRVVVGLDSGFSAFQLADPIIVGDITGNGSLSSLDTSRLSRAVVGLDAPDIPPVTIPLASIVQSGPDPKISISKSLVAAPGDSFVIPLDIDSIEDLTANPLFALDTVIFFDPDVFTIDFVTAGDVIANSSTAGWNAPGVNIDNVNGRLIIGASNINGLGGTFLGTLFNISVTVKTDSPLGPSAISIAADTTSPNRQTLANEGELALLPAPTNGADDPIDGVLTVGTPFSPELAIAADDAIKLEGNSGSAPFTFTVTRSGSTTGVTTVDYTVTGSGINPANAADFVGSMFPSGTVTFENEEATRTITILVAGDQIVEPNETFTVTLSNASSPATITTAAAIGTILNDDFIVPTIAASPLTKPYDGLPFSLTATAMDPSASLTVTADAKSKVYGQLDPALTYQITAGALVSGDSLTGALTREAGETVGVYAIQQGSLTAGGNYAVTFVGANLTIAQAAIDGHRGREEQGLRPA
jgi:hypothetical protein